jgi:hypothetical protein
VQITTSNAVLPFVRVNFLSPCKGDRCWCACLPFGCPTAGRWVCGAIASAASSPRRRHSDVEVLASCVVTITLVVLVVCVVRRDGPSLRLVVDRRWLCWDAVRGGRSLLRQAQAWDEVRP